MKDLDTPSLRARALSIHVENVEAGWWDKWPNKIDRHETAMMLVISELGEAMEGDRKSQMDKHLPHHKAFDVELADALIRLLDLAGAYEMPLSGIEALVHGYSHEMLHRTPAEQLYFVCRRIGAEYNNFGEVRSGIAGVLAVADANNIDLFPIVAEKRAYNAQREDHKREVRAAAGGKAY